MSGRWPGGFPRTPLCSCPWCGQLLDALGVPGPAAPPTPTPDDWSVCIGCGGLLRFNTDLSLRRATATELATAEDDMRREVLATQRRVRGVIVGT